MTPVPDRFDKQAREIAQACRHVAAAEVCSSCIAAALRQAADEALERAAQLCSLVPTTPRLELADSIRALASPAAAPAGEITQEQLRADLERAAPGADELAVELRKQFRIDPATEYGKHVVARSVSGTPSEPVAPSLLPRVLAALEGEANQADARWRDAGGFLRALAAELRRYIAEMEGKT